MNLQTDFQICCTCAVEHAMGTENCAICSDERQYIPEVGQKWTNLNEMRKSGFQVEIAQLEPDLYAITSTPAAGIGQQTKLLCTPEGNLLWDPIGYVDEEIVRRVQKLGEVRAIVASHPHMYGVQVAWSHALGNVPVLVSRKDHEWVARFDPVIQVWTDDTELLPGVTITQVGGHYPGSSVVHWAGGAGGRGVLLSSDTIFANPDRKSVSFMRSYPNRLPLSGKVVQRIATSVATFDFDRLYGNFDNRIEHDAIAVIRRSAQRHIDWVTGKFDDLT